jgi:phosphoribosylglycinamide formyltransferase-1
MQQQTGSKDLVLPKIVILISGRGSNMRAICEACKAERINGQVVKVISNVESAAGLDYARSEGIDYEIIDHKKFQNREHFDAALVKAVKGAVPDLICLAGFMRILTPVFVEPFEGKIVNIHPSLLPKYKGLNTHQRALDAGDAQAGVSVHLVTAELDDGPIIVQTAVDIEKNDTVSSLSQKVLDVEHETYIEAICKILN